MKILTPGDPVTGWAGDNPFFLVINTEPGPVSNVIDLDEPGWMTEKPEIMRATGEWVLVAKGGPDGMSGARPVLALRVSKGEQPYYVRRHMGSATSGVEIQIYGIGKKVPNAYETWMEQDARGEEIVRRRLVKRGHTDRLWLLPNGIVCGGDDVDIIGANILRNLSAVPA